ncbi:TPA: hypothetical protein ACOEP6_004664 [Enterobacter ludwigii]|jgi:hypothetical protein
MKIYGYKDENSELISIQEITLQVDISELKEFSSFVIHVIGLMEKHGDDFGHEHLSDFIASGIGAEIIISR